MDRKHYRHLVALPSSSKLYSRSQVLLEGGEEGLGDVDDFFTYINTVVAVDLTNLVEGDDDSN